MAKYHIIIEKRIEDWFEAETEEQAWELADEAFDNVEIEGFLTDVED